MDLESSCHKKINFENLFSKNSCHNKSCFKTGSRRHDVDTTGNKKKTHNSDEQNLKMTKDKSLKT